MHSVSSKTGLINKKDCISSQVNDSAWNWFNWHFQENTPDGKLILFSFNLIIPPKDFKIDINEDWIYLGLTCLEYTWYNNYTDTKSKIAVLSFEKRVVRKLAD